MGTVDRAVGAPFVPAGLQFAPLVEIGTADGLGRHIAFLDAEAAHVLGPVRNAAEGEVQTCRDLAFHILPPRAYVSAPGCRGITLKAGKAVARQKEHPGVRVLGTLSLVYGLGVHQGVCVEIAVGRPESRRSAECLAVGHIRAVVYVRFAGIHPPGIHAKHVKMLFHLLPEELAGALVVSVVKGLTVTKPVLHAVPEGCLIDPSPGIHLVEVSGAGVEFRPYGNHETGSEGVYAVHHPLRVGIALRVEFVAAPGVVLPVLPVLDNVVKGYMAAAEALQHGKQLLLGSIALAGLPVAHHPLRHYRGLARETAVSADNSVGIPSAYEPVIDLVLHFAPPRHSALFFLGARAQTAQAAVGDIAVRYPFDMQTAALPLLQFGAELAAVWIPGRAPYFRYDFAAVQPYAHISGIVEQEAVLSALAGLEAAVEADARAVEGEVRRTVDAAEFRCYEIFLVEGGLPSLQHRAVRRLVTSAQSAFDAFGIIEGEDFTQLGIFPRVAPAAERITVPEQAVALGRHHEWHRNLGVVLIEFLIAAIVVPFVRLMLSEAVETLLRVRAECLKHTVGLLPAGAVWGETAFILRIQQASLRIPEDYMAVPQVDLQTQGGSSEDEHGVALHFPVPVRICFLRKHTEGFAAGEAIPCRYGAHMHQGR